MRNGRGLRLPGLQFPGVTSDDVIRDSWGPDDWKAGTPVFPHVVTCMTVCDDV